MMKVEDIIEGLEDECKMCSSAGEKCEEYCPIHHALEYIKKKEIESFEEE